MNNLLENIKNYIKNYFFDLLIIVLLLIIIVLIIIKKNQTNINTKSIEDNVIATLEEPISDNNIIEDTSKKEVLVDIKGAVKNPGVYVLEEGKVVNDVIKLAGGLTKNASTDNINLSKKINNEMVIYIALKSELQKIVKEKKAENETIVLMPEVKSEEQTKVASSNIFVDKENSVGITNNNIYNETSKQDNNNQSNENNKTNNIQSINESNSNNTTNNLININKATKEELQTLTGIGESKAEKIIEYRNNNGGFKTIEEIKNVSGIGDSAFEKIKDNITV